MRFRFSLVPAYNPGMSLLNPALLFGLGLVVVPIVLHLLFRARPKRLVFPALRLLQVRRKSNVRRLRVRHLGLLLLRMAVIGALVFALTRPSLPPANYAPSLMEGLRLAGVVTLGLAAYFAVMTWWAQQPWPRHVLESRRTQLRAGVGFATFLLALLFAVWPYQRRVAAEIVAPAPNTLANVPVAAVFLCDTSLSMGYQFEGRTRLDAARKIAIEHLERLPAGSKAAVMDGLGELPPVFSIDLTSTQNRLEALTIQSASAALNDLLRTAVRFQEDDRRQAISESGEAQQERFAREVYILTDLTRSAWREDESGQLAGLLKDAEWLGVYLIDVGIEQPQNVGITAVTPTRPAVAAGQPAVIDATVTSIGAVRPEQTLELHVRGADGRSVKRDQQTVKLTSGVDAQVRFQIDGARGDFLQSEIKLVASDPLSFDDTASVTVRVLPPLKVLVAAESRSLAQYWLEALAGLNAGGTNATQPTFLTAAKLWDADLSAFDVVCLINLANPSSEGWQKLGNFVRSGGGVCVIAGGASAVAGGTMDPVAYNSPAAQDWLPASLKAQLKFARPEHFDFRETTHPLTQRLEQLGALAELINVDVLRYWSVEPNDGAVTLARWTDDASSPALLLRQVEQGRVALLTTSVDSKTWNDLLGSWTFLVVADQLLQVVSRQANESLNFRIGDPVAVSWPAERPPLPWLLRAPDFTQRALDVVLDAPSLQLPRLSASGLYEVIVTAPMPRALTAFSVMPPATESRLERLEESDLDELFGVKRYGVSRDPQQLARSVRAGRLGQEIYGLLVTLLMMIFVGEQFAATWFYREGLNEDNSSPLKSAT